MKILLIMPDANIHKLKIGGCRISFREAPLTLTTLAAMVPSELNAKIEIADESVSKVPANGKYDLVCISCMTGTAVGAYRWAAHFRQAGSKVALGGVHVSLCPDEAAAHADTILTGFSEITWPQMLGDFAAGKLQKRYDGGEGDFSLLPTPKRDLQNNWHYTIPYTVAATRGCGNACSFCSVPAARYGWQTRSISSIVEDIRKIPRKHFTFSDVNLLHDREFSLEMLREIAPLKKRWGGLAMLKIAEDAEMLTALQKAGCRYLLCGFESIYGDSLAGINKSVNNTKRYKEYMEAFHAHGISIQGCFMFGLDSDTKDIFNDTVALVNELKIDIPRYALSTPYPGTKLFAQMESEDRLLHKEWQYYDTQHVVFSPKNMTPQELDDGFIKAYHDTFKLRNVQHRLLGSPHPLVCGIGNLAYRLYLRRLRGETNRIMAND